MEHMEHPYINHSAVMNTTSTKPLLPGLIAASIWITNLQPTMKFDRFWAVKEEVW